MIGPFGDILPNILIQSQIRWSNNIIWAVSNVSFNWIVGKKWLICIQQWIIRLQLSSAHITSINRLTGCKHALHFWWTQTVHESLFCNQFREHYYRTNNKFIKTLEKLIIVIVSTIEIRRCQQWLGVFFLK